MPDDVGHFVVPAIVEILHRMHDSSVNRLQPIDHCRYRSLKNYVRGVIQKPVFVHARNGNNPSQIIVLWLLIFRLLFFRNVLVCHSPSIVVSNSASTSSTRSFSTRRLSMIKSCRSGVFFPM